MVIELVAGLWTNALVLIADAGHMFLDAAALGLAWWAARISTRGEDKNLSYGYHRFQVLAAFLNGLTLLVLVAWIAIEAFGRLLNPEPMLALPALGVAILGFVINIIAFRWLHGASDSTNVKSAALHVLGDLLGSAAAIVAALSVYFFNFYYADPILSLLIVIILGRGAIRVLRESTHILLEGVPRGFDIAEIRTTLCEAIPELEEVHHLHVWGLTSDRPLVTLHAQVNHEADYQATLESIKEVLTTSFAIEHSTIQIEIGPCPDDETR